MAGVPRSFYSAVPISFGTGLIKDLIIDLCVATLFSRLFVLVVSAALKVAHFFAKKLGRSGENSLTGKLRATIFFVRKITRHARVSLEIFVTFLIFIISHLGPWITEIFIMTQVIFVVIIGAGVWLTRFGHILPDPENISQISDWRILSGLSLFSLLLILFSSFSLGQHRFIYSALTCESFAFVDGKHLAGAPIVFGDQGIIVASRITIGTPLSIFSKVKSVDADFYPYSSIAKISAFLNNQTSSRADINGATGFGCS